jgi:hypothetical protein
VLRPRIVRCISCMLRNRSAKLHCVSLLRMDTNSTRAKLRTVTMCKDNTLSQIIDSGIPVSFDITFMLSYLDHGLF